MKATNIQFKNPDDGFPDEAQFDTVDRQELAELWFDFCLDEGFIELEEAEVE